MTPREALDRRWLNFLGSGPIGIGGDLATSAKEGSNPTCIVVMQHEPEVSLYFERLIFRFKTAEAQVSRAIFRMIVEDIMSTGRRIKAMSLDASSEVFFAQQVQQDLAGRCPVALIKGGENVNFRGVKGLAKVVMGNMFASAHEDNFIATPLAEWVVKDRRLVKREKGSFMAELGPSGEHGDTFDAGKHAYWALAGGTGNVEICAAGPGGLSGRGREDRPFGHLFGRSEVNIFH